MNIKKFKIAIVTFLTICFILIFYGILPDHSSAGSSLHDFSKGMLTGMSVGTAVVWILYLISILKKYRITDGVSLSSRFKQILLSIAMICFLTGIIATADFSDNQLLLIFGTLIMYTSLFLNIVYICDKIKHVQL